MIHSLALFFIPLAEGTEGQAWTTKCLQIWLDFIFSYLNAKETVFHTQGKTVSVRNIQNNQSVYFF